jgi:hypothetical protein
MTVISQVDMRKFEAQIQKEGPAEVAVTFSRLVRKVALQVLRGTVLRTPVDTGRARANWQVTIGSPAAGVVDAEDSGGGMAIEAGVGVLASLPPFAEVWVTNNLPYINRLEFDSWSDQAPDGMLRITVAEVENQFSMPVDVVKE